MSKFLPCMKNQPAHSWINFMNAVKWWKKIRYIQSQAQTQRKNWANLSLSDVHNAKIGEIFELTLSMTFWLFSSII